MSTRTAVRRTVLAVPGSSDRFIAKARTLPVDALFLDLEDAVAPAVKEASRQRIVEALNDPAGFQAPTVTVRVNDWTPQWTYADVIEVVTGAGARVDALVLPKCTSAAQVKALDLLLTQVEQAAGLPVGRIEIEGWGLKSSFLKALRTPAIEIYAAVRDTLLDQVLKTFDLEERIARIMHL